MFSKKCSFILFGSLFISVYAQGFLGLVDQAANSGANLALYTDTALDVLDSIDDTAEITSDVRAASQKVNRIRSELSELNYTASEIQDVLSSEGLDSQDIIQTLSQMARRIRKTKNIITRVGLLAGMQPAAVSASENMKSTAILSDIHYELKLARLDRVKDRQSVVLKEIKEKKIKKERREFFISQFELMQRKSAKTYTYSNFKVDPKNSFKKY